MINAIPIFGWIMSFILSVSLAIPFYFIWNNIAATYFFFLPAVYLNIPFWDTVGLFMIIPILKHMLIPTLVKTSTTSSTNT